MRWLVTVGVFLSLLPAAASAQVGCSFQNGFKTLHDALPVVVGSCAGAEFVQNGITFQQTDQGWLSWSPAENVVRFSDGSLLWEPTPFGVRRRGVGEVFPWEPSPGGLPTAPVSVDVAQACGRPATTREPVGDDVAAACADVQIALAFHVTYVGP